MYLCSEKGERDMRKRFCIILVICMITGCGMRMAAQPIDGALRQKELRSGDLLFVSDLTGMGRAVQQSTGVYTHVAIVERVGDSLFIIDATQKRGVARRPIDSTFAAHMPVDAYSLDRPFDTAAVIALARALVGSPYDNAFLPYNGAYYCSELVQAVFLADGKPLFASAPMKWRDAKGRIPRYWKRHFKRLGMNVPEGVPGTNPSDMARSTLLRRL